MIDPFDLAYRQVQILPGLRAGGWDLGLEIDRPQRQITVRCQGIRTLQSLDPAGRPLFTDRLRLKIQLQRYHPSDRPLVTVLSPLAHPHVARSGVLCYDSLRQEAWFRLNRDVGSLLAWQILPLLAGQPSLIAADVFSHGRSHMSEPRVADFYRAQRSQLPWDSRPLFRRF